MDTQFFVSAPPPADYIQSSQHMFFSYLPENVSFQSGYLGITHTTVSGTLHVRFPKSIEAKSITLKFVGREVVEWSDMKKARGEKIILDKSTYLWRSDSGVGHQLITDLDLPFEFAVPNDAIESFDGRFGSVTYTLQATVNTKPKRLNTCCEVIVPLWRWTRPNEEDLRPLVIKSSPKKARKVPLSWQAILPQTFFDINSEILARLRFVAHIPTLKIRKITATLKTITSYALEDRSVMPVQKSKQQAKHIIHGSEILANSMGPETVFEASVGVKIPASILPTIKTKYITVTNQLEIKVMFERSKHHVLIVKDVFIGRRWMGNGEFERLEIDLKECEEDEP
ncbi:2476_t:CDS:1 [Paraglomus brasilianum]|uniref:2476_t:CDS:1 n=1 Tax=Paraglomus brasilianum TaxID=144538 RepID=A0A9N9AUJ6_9GLOM|nr:2476_t:CDS:1 [Paraglomus brasilianum]